MNSLFQPARTQRKRHLRERIFNVLPAASFQMDRLLQLMDIVESDRSPTACVECSHQPRFHLNPDFIADHCATDESLFLLVMHELYHVILGHTRLFPRATPLHNLVFDAVINSMLCQQFSDPVYTRFFQELNPWDSFPAPLLAPPPGWPDGSAPLPEGASDAERRAINLLYGKHHEGTTYFDVFRALTECLEPGDGTVGEDVVLLGDHSGDASSGQDEDVTLTNEPLRQIVRKVVEGWPPPPIPIAGRDDGHDPTGFFLNPGPKVQSEFGRALQRILRRAGVLRPTGSNSPRSWRPIQSDREIQTILPQLRDRRQFAWKQITGLQPVFFQDRIQHRRRRLEPQKVAHVYLDVSGSMTDVLPLLGGALDRPHRQGEVRLFGFSTVVAAFRPGKPLARQSIKNTYGTDINCVLTHVFELPRGRRPKRVLIFTDGYTGPPRHDLASQLKEGGVALYVGLVGGGTSRELTSYAKHIENLPYPERKAS